MLGFVANKQSTIGSIIPVSMIEQNMQAVIDVAFDVIQNMRIEVLVGILVLLGVVEKICEPVRRITFV